jgi:hypothetical protein
MRDYGIGGEDIFISEYQNGKYQMPKPLPVEINSAFGEFNAYISPTENLIIFGSSGRADEIGGGDLYMSRKDAKGHWSPSEIMGEPINSEKLDYCPFIDWESRNFYFVSERVEYKKTKLESVNSLREIANSTLNGFGNIYKIGLDKLGRFERNDQ